MLTIRQSLYLFGFGLMFIISGGSICANIEMGPLPSTNQLYQSFFTPMYMTGTMILSIGLLMGFIGYMSLQYLACMEEERLFGHHSPIAIDGVLKLRDFCEDVFKYLHMTKHFIDDKIKEMKKP